MHTKAGRSARRLINSSKFRHTVWDLCVPFAATWIVAYLLWSLHDLSSEVVVEYSAPYQSTTWVDPGEKFTVVRYYSKIRNLPGVLDARIECPESGQVFKVITGATVNLPMGNTRREFFNTMPEEVEPDQTCFQYVWFRHAGWSGRERVDKMTPLEFRIKGDNLRE